MDIENKLAAYRARKRREAYVHKANSTLKNFFNRMSSTKVVNKAEDSGDKLVLINETETDNLSLDSEKEEETECCRFSFLTLLTYFLYFVLWTTLFLIFVKLEFGLVFIVVSALAGIYFNTRTGPKKKDEISAYSVFNKNCESIDGTLKGEQFEQEIRYGYTAMH